MVDSGVKLILPDGTSIVFDNSYANRSSFIKNFREVNQSNEINITPPSGRVFGQKSLEDVKKYLTLFPTEGPKLPLKPLVTFVAWEDYIDQNKNVKDYFAPMEDYYQFIQLFNAVWFLQINDLKELIAAKLAHHVLCLG